jgi:hypothetical protein
MKAEKIFEFEGSQNLNTTPIDITGLQGDLYDYELVTFFEVEGLASALNITCNSDTGTNYREYVMFGDGSGAGAIVDDNEDAMFSGGSSYDYPSLGVFKLSGSSGNERLISGLLSYSGNTTDTRVYKTSCYWKNTANEITSIQLTKSGSVTSNCHIILYRVPKATSQGGWEKVDEVDFTTVLGTDEPTLFSSLDGDSEKEYRVILTCSEDAGNNPAWRFNGDASVNYTTEVLRHNSGTISAILLTASKMYWAGGSNPQDYTIEAIINAESGKERLVTQTLSASGGAFGNQQDEVAGWWGDTSSNLTSISVTGIKNGSGTATLYRRMTPSSTGVLPWELVGSVDVNGNFSAGHTFSGLEGDSTTLYRVEFLHESGGTGTMLMQLNGDTGSNYNQQFLRAASSTVSAGSSTDNELKLVNSTSTGKVNIGEAIIYPKSGVSRPVLTKMAAREYSLNFYAGWWGNTADAITSLKVYASSTSTKTGTLKLYRLK